MLCTSAVDPHPHTQVAGHARFTLTVPDPDALSELVLLSGKDLSGDRLNL